MRRPSPPPVTVAPSRWSKFLVLSEESREIINRLTEYAKRTVYYGWIPFILILGMMLYLTIYPVGFWKSDPRPSIFRMLNPLS